jgi:Zn-dependent protease/CBS domain-containing protein
MFSKSFSLGRWLGIEIQVDSSWFIIFFLVTWSLAAGFFPDTYPSLDLKLNLLLGIITSILFFLSALAHELSHSLMAKTKGIAVRRITLFLFGGAAQLGDEPKTPGVEFKTAIVGPATSILLTLIFWSLKIWSRTFNLGLPWVAVFSTLASLNFILASFNLLPGFPLDGGRILRAIIWKVTGNFRQATKWAARFGRLVAWSIVLVGLSRIFVGRLGAGIWLTFLGLFLDQAVGISEKRSIWQDVLSQVLVKSVMWTNPTTVAPDTPLQKFLNNYLLPSRRRCLPVIDAEGNFVGLVSINNLKEISKPDKDEVKISEVMIPANQIPVLDPDQTLFSALEQLRQAKKAALPVITNDKLVGILSEEDLGIYLAIAGIN